MKSLVIHGHNTGTVTTKIDIHTVYTYNLQALVFSNYFINALL